VLPKPSVIVSAPPRLQHHPPRCGPSERLRLDPATPARDEKEERDQVHWRARVARNPSVTRYARFAVARRPVSCRSGSGRRRTRPARSGCDTELAHDASFGGRPLRLRVLKPMAGPRRETNRGCAASAWSSARSLGSRTPPRNSSSAPRQCCRGFSFARNRARKGGSAPRRAREAPQGSRWRFSSSSAASVSVTGVRRPERDLRGSRTRWPIPGIYG
jgi:hypothetical protein